MIIWRLGVFHVGIVTIAIYNLGVVYGLLLLYFLHRIMGIVVSPFGYEFARGNDIVHMYDLEHAPHNCFVFWEMDKISFDELKYKGFKNWAIKNLRKFRQIPVNVLGFWFWKDVDESLALEQVKMCNEDIHSQEDLLKYGDKLINVKIPVDKPQWYIEHIEDYKPNKSACVMIYHHWFTDGVGLANALLFFNDEEHRPKELPGKGRGIPWYFYYIYAFVSPIWFLTGVIELYKSKWNDLYKMKSPIGNSGSSINLMTKEYKFEDLRKWYKQFDGHTFNHFMMGVVSKSLYQWFEQNNTKEIGDLLTIVPATMKPFTFDLKELNISNYTAGSTYQFPLRKDLKEAIKETTEGFNYYHTYASLIYTVLMLKMFMIQPPVLGKLAYRHFWSKLDLTFSNIQGFREPLYLWNKKIDRIYGFLNPYCGSHVWIVTNSYNTKVWVQVSADTKIEMDPKQLIDQIENILDHQIAQATK